MPGHYPVCPGMCPFGLTLLFMGRFWKFQILCGLAWAIAWGHSTGTCRAIALVLLEIAQLGSALLGRLPEATALEPVKLPLILSGVCSLSSANYFPNPFGIFTIQSCCTFWEKIMYTVQQLCVCISTVSPSPRCIHVRLYHILDMSRNLHRPKIVL